jgi:hypothetical protein
LTKLRLSPAEVQSVVALSIPSLQGLPSSSIPVLGLEQQLFRNRFPYDVIDISNAPVVESKGRDSSEWTESLVSRGLADRVEIWGLTGWFVDVFLRKLGIWGEMTRNPLVNTASPQDAYRSGL